MFTLDLTAHSELDRLGLTLLHSLWQGAAIAFVAAAVGALLRRGKPRYRAYVLGLLLMAGCPVVTWVSVDVSGSGAAPALPRGAEVAAGATAREASAATADPVSSGLSATAREAGSAGWNQRAHEFLHAALPWMAGVWSVGVLLLSLRLAAGALVVRRWRMEREDLPYYLTVRSRALAERLGLRGFGRVYGSRHIAQPMATGCWRPVVLLPMSLVTELPADMLEAVIAHELAHIRRNDLWINLLQRVMETLLFHNPAVWWLSARVRAEREVCCDEMAVAVTGERLIYASALERAARSGLPDGDALTAGFGHDRRALLERIRHLLGMPAPAGSGAGPAGLLAGLAALTAITVSFQGNPAVAAEAGEESATARSQQKMLHVLRLVVGNQSMTLQGEEVDWQNVEGQIGLLSEPGQTVLEVAATEDVTYVRFREAWTRASQLVSERKLAYVSEVGVHVLGSKGMDVPDRRPPGLQRYQVGKTVDAFAEGDLSTPETAWAAYHRASGKMAAKGVIEASWVKISPAEMDRFWTSEPPERMAIYNNAQLEAELIEVLSYRDDVAATVSKLSFPTGVGRDPYSLRYWGRMDGKWKNLGEDRCASVESARGIVEQKKERIWEHFQAMRQQQ